MQELAGKTCVVTGAAGFIGKRLAVALAGQGADVVAVLRSRHGASKLRAAGCRTVTARLDDTEALLHAVPHADILFSFAYDMRAGFDENTAAFDGLMGWASRAAPARIVHASSAVVYDNWPVGPLDETMPITGGGQDYRSTKILMEERLAAGSVTAAILQPTIVYGPGSKIWTQIPLAALRGGGIVLPVENGRCPAVHVDDVVQAAIRAATADLPATDRFLISGADTLTWQQFYQGYADALGTGRVITEPLADLRAALGPELAPGAAPRVSAAAKLSATARRLIGHSAFEALLALKPAAKSGPARPDHAGLALFAGDTQVSIDHAQAVLGYAPQHQFLNEVQRIVSQSGNSAVNAA